MRRTVGWLMVGVILLGGGALAGDGSGVQLPPAEEEIAAMEKAFGEVTGFFAELIAELKWAVAALNEVDQELNARYRALAVQLKDAEAKLMQLADVCARVPELEKRVDGLTDRLTELTNRVTDLRRRVDSEVSRLDTRVDGVAGDLAELQAGLSGNVEELEARLLSVLSDVAGLREDVKSFSSRLSDHESRLSKLEEMDLGSLHRRVLGLEQSVQALQIKIDNNRKKIEGVEATLSGLSADISAQRSLIADLDGRVTDQEARLGEVEQMVEDLDVAALREALGTAQVLGILGLLLGAGALVLVLLSG